MQTERLTLVPYDHGDVEFAIELFGDAAVRRYAGGPMKEENIREMMPNWVRRGGGGWIGVWCIRAKSSGEKLGSLALLPMPVEQDDTDWDLLAPNRIPDNDMEVGYFLKPSTWGNGYATEACKRLLQMAFEETPLTEVVATFDEGNDASRNVLLKSGFSDRGVRRCYGADGPDFRITREEWLASRA